MRILIIHDYFKFRGGAERLILIMARALKADILCSFWSEKNSFSKTEAPAKIFTLLDKEPPRTGWRYFCYQYAFFFKTKFIKKYDLVIFSGNNCLSASHCIKKSAKKIFYCHTPVRYAYDLKKYYLKQKSFFHKPILWTFIILARIVYKWGFNQMDLIIANSRNVQTRIKKYLKTNSQIIYPPIEIEKFRWHKQDDYYLSFGRIDELKRIENIAQVFTKMPDKKLIIASSGPNLDNVKKIVQGHKNITIIGWTSDDQLAVLVGSCIATIYIPIDEDFGMTALEGMSAGKPCIAVDQGGLRETVIPNKTGLLIPKDFKINDLIDAVQKLDKTTALNMKTNCIIHACKFSKEIFVEKIKSTINSL
ncbi:MAG: glycosyltransferase [Candidatus Kuenenbacteria bacterium]